MKHTFIKYFYRSALYGVFIMHGEFPFGLYRLMIDADTLQVPFIQAVNTVSILFSAMTILSAVFQPIK